KSTKGTKRRPKAKINSNALLSWFSFVPFVLFCGRSSSFLTGPIQSAEAVADLRQYLVGDLVRVVAAGEVHDGFAVLVAVVLHVAVAVARPPDREQHDRGFRARDGRFEDRHRLVRARRNPVQTAQAERAFDGPRARGALDAADQHNLAPL